MQQIKEKKYNILEVSIIDTIHLYSNQMFWLKQAF